MRDGGRFWFATVGELDRVSDRVGLMNEHWKLLNNVGAEEYMRRVGALESFTGLRGRRREALGAYVANRVLKRIRRLVASHGQLTVVARHTGISVGTLSDILHGRATEKKVREVAKLLGILPLPLHNIQDDMWLHWKLREENRVEV
jgi:hypothetical protein